MNFALSHTGVGFRLRRHKELFRLLGLSSVCMLLGLYLLLHDKYSQLTFALVLAGFFVVYALDLPASLTVTIAYLFLLGDVRRIVNSYAGFPQLDPLLLVGPIFTTFIALPLIFGAQFSDRLSKAVLGLMAVMTLEIINPKQGSLVVGLTGALFYLIPISWFWVGRQYGSDQLLLRMAQRVVAPLGFLAALFGLCQTYLGTLPWQQAWVKHAIANGYSALGLGGGHIRSFGFSVNSVEYGTLLMMASVICCAAWLSGKQIYAFYLPFLFTALVLASMRGLILRTLLAVVIMWAVRGPTFRSWAQRLILGGLLGFGLLAYSVKHASSEPGAAGGQASTAGLATSHVTNGLAHPLDPKYSTVGLHSAMFFSGLAVGVKNPLGMGLGIVTLGAGKFAVSEYAGSSEVDVSDAFITLGLVGGPIYLLVILLAFFDAGKVILAGQREVGYLVLGLFVGMIGSWVPLGQYAAGPFMWLSVGCLAKKIVDLDRRDEAAQEDVLEPEYTVFDQELLSSYSS